MPETPQSPYDVYTASASTASTAPLAGYAVTTASDGVALATTAIVAAGLTLTYDGIALSAPSVAGATIQVQREGVVAASLVSWLGSGSVEACVVDSTGKPQRASTTSGPIIGLCTKRGDIILDLSQQSGTASNVASTLSGLRWQLARTGANVGNSAPCDPGAGQSVVMGGSSNTTYNVTLRFRGEVEVAPYIGGSNSNTFLNHGGTYEAANAGLSTLRNTYILQVSDPSDFWYLNQWNGTANINITHALDYSLVVPVRGGATISLIAAERPTLGNNSGSSSLEIRNSTSVVVSGVSPDPNPYDGQFIQVDVTSVA